MRICTSVANGRGFDQIRFDSKPTRERELFGKIKSQNERSMLVKLIRRKLVEGVARWFFDNALLFLFLIRDNLDGE